MKEESGEGSFLFLVLSSILSLDTFFGIYGSYCCLRCGSRKCIQKAFENSKNVKTEYESLEFRQYKGFGLCVLQTGEFAANKNQIQRGNVSQKNIVVWGASAVCLGEVTKP